MSSRDADITARAAKECWVDWLPGDGTAYRVHAPVIVGGPDAADRVLLVNCVRRTVAFQFSLAEYRHIEFGQWTRTRARAEGVPDWAWSAAEPLLAAYGVTKRSLLPAKPRIVDAEPAGGVL
ncbi:hypothetical protein [Amycolatopsis sp. NPDC059657]|uniref:hypothetical protein n=1 Tax=Amycolatopsis sp. NPDC059657 TaxID=3346899 RepID=UPI00366D4BBC